MSGGRVGVRNPEKAGPRRQQKEQGKEALTPQVPCWVSPAESRFVVKPGASVPMTAGPDLKVKRAVNPGRSAKTEVNRRPRRSGTPETRYHATQPPRNQQLRPLRWPLPAPVLTCLSQFLISKLNIQPLLLEPSNCLFLSHFLCLRALASVVLRCLRMLITPSETPYSALACRKSAPSTDYTRAFP